MKNSLKNDFRTAVKRRILAGVSSLALLTGSFMLASCGGQPEDDLTHTEQTSAPEEPPLYTRHLKEGEKQLARDLFGRSLDPSQVQIHVFQKEREDIAFTFFHEEQTLSIYGDRFASIDYSRESDSFLYGIFVRSLTYAWQSQNGFPHNTLKDDLYPLRDDLSFSDYGARQQASIMEDYARRVLRPEHRGHWIEEAYGPQNCAADAYLIWVVERQFPSAEIARKEIETRKTRFLTPMEKDLARLIFGDEIKPGQVQIHQMERKCSDKVAHVSSARDIFFWAGYHAEDYALHTRPFNTETYIHELVHIWQFQHGRKETNLHSSLDGKRTYPLDLKQWNFSNYGLEQQAEIIEDYFSYFLTHYKRAYQLAKDGQETVENLVMLRQLVEDRFPEARKTREHFERYGQLPLSIKQEPTEVVVASKVTSAKTPTP